MDDVVSPNTVRDPIDQLKHQLQTEYSVFDFGLKIKKRNIFYFLYLKDKLSYRRGVSLMIGEKTVFNWDNCD